MRSIVCSRKQWINWVVATRGFADLAPVGGQRKRVSVAVELLAKPH